MAAAAVNSGTAGLGDGEAVGDGVGDLAGATVGDGVVVEVAGVDVAGAVVGAGVGVGLAEGVLTVTDAAAEFTTAPALSVT